MGGGGKSRLAECLGLKKKDDENFSYHDLTRGLRRKERGGG
jgi:hypothetical protein